MRTRCIYNLCKGSITDTTCRVVDNTPQRFLIVWICHDSEIRYYIFYFLPLIKTKTSIYTIRNTVFPHLFLKRATLCIGTIQNSKIRELTMLIFTNSLNIVANNHRFFFITIGRFQDQAFPLFILAEYIFMYLFFVLTNKTVCCLYYKLCRTIVLFQLKQTSTHKHFLEIQDIVNICPSKTIDALRIITYHTKTTMIMS